MKLIKADNYQTWYVEEKNKSIIIDPWLTNSLQPDKSFFIQRTKEIDQSGSRPVCVYF